MHIGEGQHDDVRDVLIGGLFIDIDGEFIPRQVDFSVDFDKIEVVDGVGEADFKVEAAVIEPVKEFSFDVRDGLLTADRVFQHFSNIPRLITLILHEALLVDEIISLVVEKTCDEKTAIFDEFKAQGAKGVEVLVVGGVGLRQKSLRDSLGEL